MSEIMPGSIEKDKEQAVVWAESPNLPQFWLTISREAMKNADTFRIRVNKQTHTIEFAEGTENEVTIRVRPKT